MLPSLARLVLVLAVLTLAASCNRASTSTTSPATSAYTDGFEVVVFELRAGVPAAARSLSLREAERAVASGSEALIPGDPATVQRQIAAGKGGDSRVLLSVRPIGESKQQVRLSFHEGNRTFVYEYVVDGRVLRPVASEYRDLAGSRVVRYAGE